MEFVDKKILAVIEGQESAYEMAVINPKLCKALSIQVEIEQRDEGPIPHLHIFHDKTRNPKRCSYVRLDKPEYAPHHDEVCLTKKQKDEFIKVMTTEWSMPRGQGVQRGYDRAVDTWIDTFEADEEEGLKKFQLDDNGNYVMPDYSLLKTIG